MYPSPGRLEYEAKAGPFQKPRSTRHPGRVSSQPKAVKWVSEAFSRVRTMMRVLQNSMLPAGSRAIGKQTRQVHQAICQWKVSRWALKLYVRRRESVV